MVVIVIVVVALAAIVVVVAGVEVLGFRVILDLARGVIEIEIVIVTYGLTLQIPYSFQRKLLRVAHVR